MSDPLIIWTRDFGAAQLTVIGGKCRGIGWLQTAGLETPPGFCVTSYAFDLFFRSALVDAATNSYAQIILESDLPAELIEKLREAAHELSDGRDEQRFAVRSSFGTEDSASALSAGQYETVLNVGASDLPDAIKRVWASAFSEAAIQYRSARGSSVREQRLAVLVQPYIQTLIGGVALTIDPSTQDVERITVESVSGQPDGVTGGGGDCNRYVVSKLTLARIRSWEPISGAQLSEKELRRLVEGCKDVERHTNSPVEIEWGMRGPEEFIFLQARVVPYSRKAFIGLISKTSESDLRSPKVRAMVLLANSPRTLSHVVGPGAFELFVKRGGISPELAAALDPMLDSYLSRGEVSIRPAYWSALNSGNNLPQSGRLKTLDECKNHLTAFWQFIIQNGLDDYTAEAACIVSNWLPVYACAVCLTNHDTGRLVIHALYGFFEGLEQYPYDTYLVSLDQMKIVDRQIARKSYALYSPSRGGEAVSDEQATGAVLTEEEIIEIAQLINNAPQRGEMRFEVLIAAGRGAEAIIPWQMETVGVIPDALALYRIELAVAGGAGAVTTGQAVAVTSGSPVYPIVGINNPIIVIENSKSVTRDRQWVIDLALKAKEAGAVVCFEGSILSHFATTLREFGVQVYPVAAVKPQIRTGDRVAITPIVE